MDEAAFDPDRIDAVVFDVIGTLVDEEGARTSAARRLAAEVGVDDADDLDARWVAGLDRLMSAVVDGSAAWRPHRELIVQAAREAVRDAGGDASSASVDAVASLDAEYAAWPDTASATAALRRDRLVIGLSNGDLDALALLANAGSLSWDVALSSGSVRTFKPAPAAYRHAIDALRLDPARTLFVAAHPWDLRAASEHGFRTAWIARPGADRPTERDRFDLQAADLHELVAALGGSPDGR